MAVPPYKPTLQTPNLTLTLMILPDDLPFRKQLFVDFHNLTPAEAALPRWSLDTIGKGIARTHENHILASLDGPPDTCYIIRWRETHEPIGAIMFFRRDVLMPPEFGFSLLNKWQGQGLGTEAVGEVMRHLTLEAGVKEIAIITEATNLATRKLCAKLGLVEGETVELEVTDGGDGKVLEMIAHILPGMKNVGRVHLVSSGRQIELENQARDWEERERLEVS